MPRKEVVCFVVFGGWLILLASSSALAQSNLTPYQPTGWSDRIVVSKGTGTHSDSSGLTSTDTLYVDWAVLNNGSAAAGVLFKSELYVDGALRATWNTNPPLNPNFYTSVDDYSLGALSAGTHTLRIKTDATSVISESNEGDNEYSKTITIGGSGSPNLTPYQPTDWSDRIVVSKGTGTHSDSSGLTSADTLYVDWAVLNNGSAAAGVLFKSELYVDGALRATWNTNPPLNPNFYTSVDDYSLSALSAGTHTLRIKTDATSVISESNEGDNEYSKTITIGGSGSPNLAPYQPTDWSDRIVVSKGTGTHSDSSGLTSTDTLYVDWAVLNNGSAAAGVLFKSELYVDGALRATWNTNPPLNPNFYTSVDDYSLSALSAGTHTLRIKTDATSVISESNEGDNEYSKTITIGGSGSPNLAPYQPTNWSDRIVVSKGTGTHSDSSGLTSTDTLYVDWAVLNNGSAAAGGLFKSQLYVDGALRATWNTNPPLNPNFYTSVDDYSLGALSAGAHTLRIKTDATSVISESNEGDNEYSKTITISGSGSPNLTPYQPTDWSDRIVVSKGTGTHSDSSGLTSTDTLYVDWAVLNNGSAAAGVLFKSQLYVDGALRATWNTNPPLNPNFYTSVDDYSLGTLSAGTHTLRIKTDATSVISENNEGDNEYSRTITIGGSGSPNLTPFQPTGWTDKVVVSKGTGTHSDSSGLTSTDTLYVDWAVLNNGSVAAGVLFKSQLYVDGALRATWNTNPPLNPNFYTSVDDYSLGTLSAGTHTLRIKTDATSVISESNEGDNEYSKTITIGGGGSPNLTPYKPTGWSDRIVVSKGTGTHSDSSGLTPTDTLYVDWAVLNNGSAAAGVLFKNDLYVDGVLRATWSTNPPLSPSAYTSTSDYSLGKLSVGAHILRIKADSTNALTESNEQDNEYTRTISVAPQRSIFVGIFGGGLGDVPDDPDQELDIWRNENILPYIKANVAFCNANVCLPKNDTHLAKIASSEIGGIVSLGFFMTSFTGVSSLNTPGNSEIPKTYIVSNYMPGDKVYVVGFSAGGGDAQNVLEKLDDLGISVRVSGHIDSVEIGDDASIPANTAVAKNYFQTQSPRIVRGESKLVANDPNSTSVTNTKITDPVGPAPATDKYAHHRNMDNDARVWGDIKSAIIVASQTAGTNSVDTDAGSRTGCTECLDTNPTRDVAEWTSVLRTALEGKISGEDLYRIRDQMARAVNDAGAFRELLVEHDKASYNPKLQENLTAVVLKVKPHEFLADVEKTAATTVDYPLFVAIVHSLAGVRTTESKKSLLRLVEGNRLDIAPGKVIDAVVSAYYGGREADKDAAWMLEWVASGTLSDYQMYAMARMLVYAKSEPAVQTLLDEIEKRMRDEQLRAKLIATRNGSRLQRN